LAFGKYRIAAMSNFKALTQREKFAVGERNKTAILAHELMSFSPTANTELRQ
jgi:hypothetical protein